jgi:hypothetical protein
VHGHDGRIDQRHVCTFVVTPEQIGFVHAARPIEVKRDSLEKNSGVNSDGRPSAASSPELQYVALSGFAVHASNVSSASSRNSGFISIARRSGGWAIC